MNQAAVIIAAVAGEVKPLVRSWAAVESVGGVAGWHHPTAPVLVLYGGMGAAAATRTFARALQLCQPAWLWSVGWAGALQAETEAGRVLWPASVRDLRTGESFACAATGTGGALLTSARVATHVEKHRLAAYPGAVAVDMEAAALARLALAHAIPFRAAKAISDTLDEQLPDMNPYLRLDGRFATGRFALDAALHPQAWGSLIRFGRQARLAADELCAALRREIGVD